MTPAPERLRLAAVRKSFGATRAVDDVTLSVASGEFVTLLGASGCGKTTLLRIAAGFTAPDAGRVLIDGADATDAPPGARGMGFVFQSYALFPTKTVAENIGFALSVRGDRRREAAARVREVAALVAIERLLERFPHELSGGQQQRVAIARAIVNGPALLLADEPTGALDSRTALEIMALFQALNRAGLAVLLVTHEPEMARFASRLLRFRDGRLAEDSAQVPEDAARLRDALTVAA